MKTLFPFLYVPWLALFMLNGVLHSTGGIHKWVHSLFVTLMCTGKWEPISMLHWMVCNTLASLFVAGVSGLDLCLPNCTWAGDMTIDLLPWDAGTDDGVTYMVS